MEEMQQICTKALDRVSSAKSPKGVDAACNAGLKKIRDVSSRLFDQSLGIKYIKKIEVVQRNP